MQTKQLELLRAAAVVYIVDIKYKYGLLKLFFFSKSCFIKFALSMIRSLLKIVQLFFYTPHFKTARVWPLAVFICLSFSITCC